MPWTTRRGLACDRLWFGRVRPGEPTDRWCALATVGVDAAGGVTGLSVLLMGSSGNHTADLVMKGSGAVAMTSAWILLHVSYARRYRWIYQRLGSGLEFPGEAHAPTAVDFLDFSMTMGASFTTSDVNVTHTRMRAHVIVHSVLSFFYHAVVLAVAFRILTGGRTDSTPVFRSSGIVFVRGWFSSRRCAGSASPAGLL